MAQKYTKYDPKFKVEVVSYILKNNLGHLEAARHFNIGSTPQNGSKVIKLWEDAYNQKGFEGLMKSKPGRPINLPNKERVYKPVKNKEAKQKNLIKEVEYLRAENDYLKKLNALALERTKQVRKKK